MVLNQTTNLSEDKKPLDIADVELPEPGKRELLIEVLKCGVCHTELDEIEGRTPPPRFPVVLGHQVVGTVRENGPGATMFNIGDRVGVAWIYYACGHCQYCRTGYENLCPDFKATGRDVHGGYAEFMTVPEEFAHVIPDELGDAQAAPLLCAGAIGYRSLRLTNLSDGQPFGLTGFGASGHQVLIMAQSIFPNSDIYVFARNPQQREFALDLGASWAGDTVEKAPERLMAMIDTTPAWKPIIEALGNLAPGGRLVINAIRKEDGDKKALLDLDYGRHLWMEREIKSVANITRNDVREFLALAADTGLKPELQEYDLEDANEALVDMKESRIHGAKVLSIG